jgi:hypothetical protein
MLKKGGLSSRENSDTPSGTLIPPSPEKRRGAQGCPAAGRDQQACGWSAGVTTAFD